MASRQAAAKRKGILATRGRKIAAAIAAAFLASIGAGIGARTLTGAESVTKKALAGSSAPIEVRVMPHGSFFGGTPIGQYYVVPKSDTSSPNDLDPAELSGDSGDNPFNFALSERHHGVEGSPQIVRLQIHAKGDEPVTINAVKIHVAKRAAPIKGWYVVSGGCGGLAVRTAEIDLDSPMPVAHFLDKFGAPSAKHMTLFVTRTTIEQIELQASTRKSLVDWTAEVFYAGPDGEGSLTVDDGGQPFRVTSETASDGYTLSFVDARKVIEREHSWDGSGISMC
jgi:hypothetical protein